MNIIKTKNFELHILKHYGELCWRTITRKPSSTCTSTFSINPIPKWCRIIKWKFTYLYLLLSDQKYKQCQGCGEGISKYKIRDPNYGHGNEWFNCCNACVSYYDARFSRRKIIKWKNKKSIGKNI